MMGLVPAGTVVLFCWLSSCCFKFLSLSLHVKVCYCVASNRQQTLEGHDKTDTIYNKLKPINTKVRI